MWRVVVYRSDIFGGAPIWIHKDLTSMVFVCNLLRTAMTDAFRDQLYGGISWKELRFSVEWDEERFRGEPT